MDGIGATGCMLVLAVADMDGLVVVVPSLCNHAVSFPEVGAQ